VNVKAIVLGPLEENCYILEKDGKTLIIDPGAEFFKIEREIKNEVLAVIVTHSHHDHIGALEDVLTKYNCPKYDFSNLKEQEYQIGPFRFKIIYTKGHTDDSITIYFEDEKMMFAGDFIFKDSIGRWDLPTGNLDALKGSVKKIGKYPEDITVFSGHGPKTTIKDFKIWTRSYFI